MRLVRRLLRREPPPFGTSVVLPDYPEAALSARHGWMWAETQVLNRLATLTARKDPLSAARQMFGGDR